MGKIIDDNIEIIDIEELQNYCIEDYTVIYKGKKYKGNDYYYRISSYILVEVDIETDEVRELVEINSNTNFVALLEIDDETVEVIPINKSII